MIEVAEEIGNMIVVMQTNAGPEHIRAVVQRIEEMGYRPNVSEGEETTIIGVIGHSSPDQLASLEFMPGVDRMVPVTKPYKLGSRDFRPRSTVVHVGNVRFGGEPVVMIAGPCSVESADQLWEAAR
ncbi:MAG TPA: 3-deoxy-7-phosphoheptulonate synthase, partial [Chloroflexota bacterium]